MALTKIRRFKFWLRKQKVKAFCTMVRLLSFSKKVETVSLPLPKSLNKILFLRTDGKVGDFIVSTFALQEMAKFYGCKIDILTDGALLELAAIQPFIGQVLNKQQYLGKWKVRSKILNSVILGFKLRKRGYDLTIDVEDDGLKLESAITTYLGKAKFRLAFNPPPKDRIINVALFYDFKALKHFTHVYNEVLRALGINSIPQNQIQYQLTLTTESESVAQALVDQLRANNWPIVAFNVFAGGRDRNFTINQVKAILNALSRVQWILLGPWQKLQELQSCLGKLPNVVFPIDILRSWQILGSLSLIKASDALVSVDTFAIHAAVCFKKSLFGIFSEFKSHVWGSLQQQNNQYLYVYDNGLSVPELANADLVIALDEWTARQNGIGSSHDVEKT